MNIIGRAFFVGSDVQKSELSMYIQLALECVKKKTTTAHWLVKLKNYTLLSLFICLFSKTLFMNTIQMLRERQADSVSTSPIGSKFTTTSGRPSAVCVALCCGAL